MIQYILDFLDIPLDSVSVEAQCIFGLVIVILFLFGFSKTLLNWIERLFT